MQDNIVDSGIVVCFMQSSSTLPSANRCKSLQLNQTQTIETYRELRKIAIFRKCNFFERTHINIFFFIKLFNSLIFIC